MFTKMKSCLLCLAALIACGPVYAEDVYLSDGQSYAIDYMIDGSLWIETASVSLYNPAHITGFAITGSGAVLDIYGGRIDYMLLVSTSDNGLPDGIVTIYGTDFAIDGVPVAPDTPELFLANKTLTGVYEDGTAFSMVVDCAVSGNASYLHYQTLKLGWVVQQPQIEIACTEYDFGEANIGSAVSGVVTVSNIGNANLNLQSVSILQDEPVHFGFTPLQVIPVTLEPGSAIDIEIFFYPALGGSSEAILRLTSSDPAAPEVDIRLIGTGLITELTAQENAQAILEFLEEGFAAGTIVGEGKGKSAWHKAYAFQRMLLTARQLIDAGYDRVALIALYDAYKKCDGRRMPPDFVSGQDVPDLNAMIADLINQIKNQ